MPSRRSLLVAAMAPDRSGWGTLARDERKSPPGRCSASFAMRPARLCPGVTLTVRSAATGVTRTAISDSEGRYRVSSLDPGEYELRAELANFKTAIRTGVVRHGRRHDRSGRRR